MSWKAIWGLVKTALWRWWNDNTFTLGAALAFYTVFSLAPVVLIALAVAGLFFEKETAREELVRQINDTVGPQVGKDIEAIAQYTLDHGTGTLATLIGLVVLFFGATSVFAELQTVLNIIWGVKRKEGTGWWSMVKDRFWSFAIVLGMGFLLLVALVISAVLAALSRFLTPSVLPGGTHFWQVVNWLISFGLVTLLFTLIYKLLPDVQIEWGDVWAGAAVTALLFVLGKYLIGLYLGQSAWISGFGAAGSLVVVLMWVYYSSQIFLLGAEFTYVYADHHGKPIVPKQNAEALTEEARARRGMSRRRDQPANGTPPRAGHALSGENARTGPARGGHAPGGDAGAEPAVAGKRPVVQWLRTTWEKLRGSYWFLPAVLTALAAGLALLTVQVDQILPHHWMSAIAWIYVRGPAGARAVLSTVAQSMITVAGVVFSITIVTLALASNQFGPRLLRNFMRDRGNQLVLGTFVATFVYCLLVLRTVSGGSNEFVPHLSVTVAIFLAVASVGVLIYFIHHVSMSVQAPEIVANVAADLHAAIDRLFPEDFGDEAGEESQEDPAPLPSELARAACPLLATAHGYVQAIDSDMVLELATQNDLLIRLNVRPGHFVVKGGLLALMGPGERLSDGMAKQLRETFLIGSRQTPFQDVQYTIEQLVQIAVRALSPGVNDPFTAVTCLDRLGEALCHLATRKIPSPFRHDAAGRLRAISCSVTFAQIAAVAFGQIRHYGRSDAVVLLRLMGVIHIVLRQAGRESDRAALLHHALLTKEAGAALTEEESRRAVENAYQEVVRAARTTVRFSDQLPEGYVGSA